MFLTSNDFMKKSIKVFIQKVEEDARPGVLTGGFASIKGGFMTFASVLDNTNTNCTNEASSCSSTNGNCTNGGSTDCGKATNTNSCTNTAVCEPSCMPSFF